MGKRVMPPRLRLEQLYREQQQQQQASSFSFLKDFFYYKPKNVKKKKKRRRKKKRRKNTIDYDYENYDYYDSEPQGLFSTLAYTVDKLTPSASTMSSIFSTMGGFVQSK